MDRTDLHPKREFCLTGPGRVWGVKRTDGMRRPQKVGKTVKIDPLSALSHLAPDRCPAYIESGCRWPRSCRSVRTSNGSNRGSARVAWCFHFKFGCHPHVAWGVHRLVVAALPPYSAKALTSGFGSSRMIAMEGIHHAQTFTTIPPLSALHTSGITFQPTVLVPGRAQLCSASRHCRIHKQPSF
jgi:hypothetical protein